MCNLMSTKMSIKEEKNGDGFAELIQKVKEAQKIVKNNGEKVSKLQTMVEQFSTFVSEVVEEQTQAERSLFEVLDTVKKLSSQAGSKENYPTSGKKRRSLRLISNNNRSPAVLKADDLRKSAMTKSLYDKCAKYQINSPRVEVSEGSLSLTFLVF